MPRKTRHGAATKPSANPALHATTLYLLVFVCGAALMSLEIVGSRVLAPYFGSSIFVWGSLIGIFLGALSIGYFLGGKIADVWPRFEPLAAFVMASGITILAVIFLAKPICSYLDSADFGRRFGPLLGSIILFSIPSVLLGTVSPYAVRLLAQDVSSMGKVAGALYALSTLGSIFGTLLTSFILIPLIGSRWILISIHATLIGTCVVLLFVRFAAGLGGLPLAKAASFLSVGAIMSASSPEELYPYHEGCEVVEKRESAYQHILVVDYIDQNDYSNNQRRLLFDRYLQSAVYLDTLDTDHCVPSTTYTDLLHLPLIFNEKPTSVLIIGGGGCVMPTVFRQQYPWMDIDIVEIDPVVIEMARKHFALSRVEGDKVRVHVDDGRAFLRRSKKKYDLVILDAYTSAGRIPIHLVSQEFFKEVRQHLTKKGIVLVNIISAMRGRGARFYYSALHTASSVFSQAYVFPRVTGDMFIKEEQTNLILILTQDAIPLKKTQVVQQAKDLMLRGVVTLPTFVHYAKYFQAGESNSTEIREAPLFTDSHNPSDLYAIR